MIFSTENAISKILKLEKTQTRRIVKPDDEWLLEGKAYASYRTGKWTGGREVGRTYAVQPGRGKKALWWYVHPTMGPTVWSDNAPQTLWPSAKPLRIRILAIWREDVRMISEDDARAEGYSHARDFLHAWCAMHDPALERTLWGEAALMARPIDRYQAWALSFSIAR